jgi:cell wall-associated NlpC family hydrolase
LSGRAIAIAVSVLATVALLPGSSLADPPQAELTIDQVQAKVDALYVELETASETANEAKVKADETRANLETLRSNLQRLESDFDTAIDDAGMFAAAQYRNAGLDPSVQLLLTRSGDDFLSRMSQLDHLADRQARAVGNLADAKAAMEQQELAIERESARLDALEATTAEAEATADASLKEANALLDRLTAEEAARLAAARARAAAAAARATAPSADDTAPSADDTATAPPPPVSGPAEGRAKIAVDTAMAQIGDPYRYGATGPDSFDCSGLTMFSWAAAGVSLPHSSRSQMGYGTPVSSGDLQPGDLVFYYSPVHHVAMYIGNGMIVHASSPGRPVGVAGVFSMPYSGAVRVG